MLKNVDLILLKDDEHNFEIDVRTTEEEDGFSTLLLRINRRRKYDVCKKCQNDIH